ALRLSEWMVSVALDVKDPSLKALALRAKGSGLFSVDDYIQSIEYFDEALKIFCEVGDELEIARTMMNRVFAYLRLSRFDEALADADRVTETFTKLGDERRLAQHLVNVGNVYFRLDRFHEHLQLLERAEAIFLRIGDSKSLCTVHMNRAVVLTCLNKADEAFKFYALARQLADENELPQIATQCDSNMSCRYFLHVMYTKALERLHAVW